MKYKIATTYIFLFWLAIFLCGLWVFKMLLQASAVPEFATGLVGGAVYALLMREVGTTVSDAAKDLVDELRREPSNSIKG